MCLQFDGPLPSNTPNEASPTNADDNLVIRGNLFFNGPADLSIGDGQDGGDSSE